VGTPLLRGDRALSERAFPWLTGTALLILALAELAASGAFGAVSRWLDQRPEDHVLRGYTSVGLFLGVAAVVLGGLSAVYSLRKRPLQERLAAGRGPMTLWLWLHVAAGIVALAAALLHAGSGLVSAELSSGKILVVVFALLALSGVGWRVAYRVVPPRVAPLIGNYAQRGNDRRAEALAVEIEKVAAGGSAALRGVAAALLAPDARAAIVDDARGKVAPGEGSRLAEIEELAAARRRALVRRGAQARAVATLQAWRLAHVPLTLLVVPALVVHVVGALDLHVKAVGVGDAPLRALSGLHRSTDCATCHRAIVAQWSASMHAHASRSPVTVAQNNQLLAADLRDVASPDPRHICVNCHAPVAVAATGRARLPLRRGGYEDAFLDEGVSCAACHQWRGAEGPGVGGLASFLKGLRPGSTYFGEIEDPVGNAFHRSRAASVFGRDGALCASCHDVLYDTDGDGKITRGVDLVLQTTEEEYRDYRARGGGATCVACHMPVVPDATRVAERASLGTQQDRTAPAREVHDHSFVGVDYPIDDLRDRELQRPAREALLRAAARLELDPPPALRNGELVVGVAITNVGVGHSLPSGFAFARQMWLEVKIEGDGKPLLASGVLANASDDLCDAATFDEADNPARRFMVGCRASDRLLVNFQQKLVDRVEVDRDRAGAPKLDARGSTRAVAAPGAKEAWLQHLTAGAIPRVRSVDGAVLSPLAPDETRRFTYKVPVGGARRVTASVRLLFRSLAPYMLRALASGQAPDEAPLAPMIENLLVTEMAARTIIADTVRR
jgi:hypothetical protein